MMRSAADLDTPNSSASWRMVKFVRQYAATGSARSSNGRLHGRPLPTASAPPRRCTVTSFPKQRGLSPVNGAIQEGSDAVITPVTLRSSQPWISPRTSHHLPAYRETAMPPEVRTPLPAISEGIRQSAVEVYGVQGGHLTLQLGPGP
ncbi:hypothetical protein Lfu02_80250 [Longispora fulva]|nr:hypothetical protein Lfu02_80250 [Longispora fulva]